MKNKKAIAFNFIYNNFLHILQEKIFKRFFYYNKIKKIKKEIIFNKLFDNKILIKKKTETNNIQLNQKFLLKLFAIERIKVNKFLLSLHMLIIYVKYFKIFIIFIMQSKKMFLFNSFIIVTKQAKFWIFINQLLAVVNLNTVKIDYHKLTRNLVKEISYFNEKNFQINKKKKKLIINSSFLINWSIFPKKLNFYRFVYINIIYLIIGQKKLSDYLHSNLKIILKFKK
jgi:hypothetical protein